ncbi:hypothetical protein C2G38_2257167 [Gigaspora rosea]|uniref:Uncharacterized protein n=1 Tax=Gigaspora rosea TaxID=44941 RepID=A0A397W9R4_9GLOM|nr:hypothetical protein C2G38_2257167 [Gigaspora rosea]
MEQLKNKNLFEGKNVTIRNIKHWEDSNHLLVFFLSQTPDSICALYRNKAIVPENVKDLLKASVSEQQILIFMQSAEEIAQHSEVWPFFDEINTYNHIVLIAHRILLENKMHQNIRLYAACNPYRLRQKSDTQAGLLAKRYEEQSRLAYQVHPLLDQILDYVWNYGVLKASDKKIYIYIMFKKFLQDLGTELFAELLVASQEFTQNNEGCIVLVFKMSNELSSWLNFLTRALKIHIEDLYLDGARMILQGLIY